MFLPGLEQAIQGDFEGRCVLCRLTDASSCHLRDKCDGLKYGDYPIARRRELMEHVA